MSREQRRDQDPFKLYNKTVNRTLLALGRLFYFRMCLYGVKLELHGELGGVLVAFGGDLPIVLFAESLGDGKP